MNRCTWFAGSVVAFVAVVALASGSETRSDGFPRHPRERLFARDAEGSFGNIIRGNARLVVIFAPRIEACSPQEIDAVRALARAQRDYSDLLLVTTIPETTPERVRHRGVYGEAFPGSLLLVAPDAWAAESQVAPRPRIEVWSGAGELLLMRSVPPSVTEQGLYEEIVWTRSFTSPQDREEP